MSDVLITNEENDIVVGLRYEKKSMERPEVVLSCNDLKHVKELIAEKKDCVIICIHDPMLAKALFVDCKEREPIDVFFVKRTAVVYGKRPTRR